jgi:hypothetical protein
MAESKRIEHQPIERVERLQAEERSMSATLAQGAASGAAGAVAGAVTQQALAKLGSLGKQKQEQKK